MSGIKLGWRFALVGFLISVLFLLFWYTDDKFNFFHLPTIENAPTGNYSQPASRAALEKLNFILCPPLVVTFIGMDMGTTANLVLWSISAVLNAGLYFVLGLLFDLLRKRLRTFRSKVET